MEFAGGSTANVAYTNTQVGIIVASFNGTGTTTLRVSDVTAVLSNGAATPVSGVQRLPGGDNVFLIEVGHGSLGS